MFSTDNLFFLILFIVPGAFFLLFNKYLKPVPVIEKDETLRLAGALFFSFVVFALAIAFFQDDYNVFSKQENIFEDNTLLLKIVIINIAMSFIFSCIWWGFQKYILHWFINLFNLAMKRPKETRNSSVWQDIFEDGLLGDISKHVVKVEKDGICSVGFINAYSPPTSEKIEILMKYTTDIQKYFEYDEKQIQEDKKIFQNVLYEYLNLSEGIKITFYDMTKYREYLKQHERENAKQGDV